MRAAVLIVSLLAVVALAVALRERGSASPGTPQVDQGGKPGQAACTGTPPAFEVTAPPTPVNTTALGPGSPAPYELGAPLSGARPRGVMMVVHGGAWTMTGPAMLSQARPLAEDWRARGWATANVDYRPCGVSLDDVLAQYDLVRAKVGPQTPICLDGESAGGHLALMVAALRDDVACVIARAAPTDGPSLGDQPATDPATRAPSEIAPERLEVGMAQAFGERALDDFSPTTHAAALRARLLLPFAADDTIVPPAQAGTLERAVNDASPETYVRTVELAPGPTPWVHGTADDASLAKLRKAEDELVAPLDGEVPERVDGWW